MWSPAVDSLLRPAGNPPVGQGRVPVGIGARHSERRGERGMVTAELAFASIGAALACVLLAWVLALVGLLLRCQATVVEVARQEARGDRDAVARVLAERPAGSRVTIARDAGRVRVRIELAARPWAEWLPSVPLTADAAVDQEPA